VVRGGVDVLVGGAVRCLPRRACWPPTGSDSRWAKAQPRTCSSNRVGSGFGRFGASDAPYLPIPAPGDGGGRPPAGSGGEL